MILGVLSPVIMRGMLLAVELGLNQLLLLYGGRGHIFPQSVIKKLLEPLRVVEDACLLFVRALLYLLHSRFGSLLLCHRLHEVLYHLG